MKIGLTGSIACGKSTVSAYLRALGYPVVDADAVSRSLTAPGGEALGALREAFGDGVFDGGALDRRALGALVFSSPAQRERLNALLHPLIIASVSRQLEALDTAEGLVFGDIPLLYECGMEALFARIWVVSAPREAQLSRLCARDGLTREEAERRIASQMPLAEKCRRADAVISTDGPLGCAHGQIDALLAALALPAERSLR
ncbi:MAG: dephospho-CoA kinase [Clostridia bacterium]|nr:dephospho-CoA kinase [Clostridia bacterium]